MSKPTQEQLERVYRAAKFLAYKYACGLAADLSLKPEKQELVDAVRAAEQPRWTVDEPSSAEFVGSRVIRSYLALSGPRRLMANDANRIARLLNEDDKERKP